MTHVSKAYRKFLAEAGHKVRAIYGDDAFSAKAFKEVSEEHSVKVVTTVAKNDHIRGGATGDKLGIVDRLARTLKSMLNRSMLQDGSTKWVRLLADVIKLHNSTPHSTLPDNRCPDSVYEDKLLLYKIHQRIKRTMWK
jgi:hypothetical protein